MAAMGSPITRPRKTLEDYLALSDDVRAELIDGELYVSPAPGMPHQDVVGTLFRRLADEVERLGAGKAWIAPCDVHLPTGDVVQPDMFVVPSEQTDLVHRDGVHGAPALVIEVLSPFHPERDRFVKMWRYAQSGVAEYWIVDPEARSIEVFRLESPGGARDGAGGEPRFTPAGWFRGEDGVRSGVLPGLDLPLSAVFTP